MKQTKTLFVSVLALSVGISFAFSKVDQAAVKAACCYFAAKDKDINQPGQKAFISWNPQEHLEAFTVQPKFEGNAVDFGMVIPTPARPKLDEMPRDFFKDLAIYTILMPLPQPLSFPGDEERMMQKCKSMAAPSSAAFRGSMRRDRVKVLESGVVGSLDYKIIVADDSRALFEWLKTNKYSYGGDEKTLQFYIEKKWFFTVMKIDPKQMKRAANGSYVGEVTPTRFTFKSAQCIYPLKITQLSVKDRTEALFYVQSPREMDLPGDWSWMHSYRVMYLTYMLGCGADAQQQKELQARNQWLSDKVAKDSAYETTKLEWAKKLGNSDISVLEDPLKNYRQMGTGELPAGAKVVSVDEFIAEGKAQYTKTHQGKELSDYVKTRLAAMSDSLQPGKGMIVKYDPKSIGKGFIYTQYAWYPAREAPLDEVKQLTRLKGHLQNGQWLTKFRKTIRKDEMTHDLELAEVPQAMEQTYIRIMPTSPP